MSPDDAEFADLDRYITWQLGRAAARLDSCIDTRAMLREVLLSSGTGNNYDEQVDVIPRE